MFQKDISWKNLFKHDDVFIDVVTVLSALDENGYCRKEQRTELEERKQQLARLVSNETPKSALDSDNIVDPTCALLPAKAVNVSANTNSCTSTSSSATTSATTSTTSNPTIGSAVLDTSISVIEKDTNSSYYNSSSQKERELHRDVFRDWLINNVKIACIGLENQTDIDSEMPIRVLGYDMSHYRAQISANKRKHNRNPNRNNINRELEGKNSILPVITLVLYMGVTKQWKKPLSLTDCLDLENIPVGLRHLIQNYKMNLFQLAFLPPETINLFTSDIAIIIDYLQQKQATMKYDPNKNGGIGKNRWMLHPQETLGVLSNLCGEKSVEKLYHIHNNRNVTGGITMCEVIDNIKAEAKAEGISEEKARAEQILAEEKARAEQVLAEEKARAEQVLAEERANTNTKVAKAQSEGELKRANLLSRLYELLKADGRDNELPSALSNEEFYQKLLHDYQLA